MGLAAEVCIQAYTDSVQGKLVPEEEGRPLRGKGGLTEREGLLSETLVQTHTLRDCGAAQSKHGQCDPEAVNWVWKPETRKEVSEKKQPEKNKTEIKITSG